MGSVAPITGSRHAQDFKMMGKCNTDERRQGAHSKSCKSSRLCHLFVSLSHVVTRCLPLPRFLLPNIFHRTYSNPSSSYKSPYCSGHVLSLTARTSDLRLTFLLYFLRGLQLFFDLPLLRSQPSFWRIAAVTLSDARTQVAFPRAENKRGERQANHVETAPG